MRLIADTNLLLRIMLLDDPAQARVAEQALEDAEQVIIPMPALCEMVWVLRMGYRKSRSDIALAVRELVGAGKMLFDRRSAEAGLEAIEAGADFADGVIASQGRRMGGSVFASFDRRAVSVLQSQGHNVRLLTAAKAHE